MLNLFRIPLLFSATGCAGGITAIPLTAKPSHDAHATCRAIVETIEEMEIVSDKRWSVSCKTISTKKAVM